VVGAFDTFFLLCGRRRTVETCSKLAHFYVYATQPTQSWNAATYRRLLLALGAFFGNSKEFYSKLTAFGQESEFLDICARVLFIALINAYTSLKRHRILQIW